MFCCGLCWGHLHGHCVGLGQGPGAAEVVSWLWCPDLLVCVLSGWTGKTVMLTSPSQAPTLLGRVLGQDLLYSSYPLKPHCFFCIPGQTDLLIVLQYYPPPLWFSVGLGVPFMTMFLSLSCLFVYDLLLCGSCLVSPLLFFRRKLV